MPKPGLPLWCVQVYGSFQSKANDFGGGPGNFCLFFFNFMFMIIDSRHEDLQLFWLSFKIDLFLYPWPISGNSGCFHLGIWVMYLLVWVASSSVLRSLVSSAVFAFRLSSSWESNRKRETAANKERRHDSFLDFRKINFWIKNFKWEPNVICWKPSGGYQIEVMGFVKL